jgi:hypothetical protein
MSSILPLVAVDPSIASSYGKDGKTGGPRSNLTSLAKLGKAGIAVSEVAVALKALSDIVASAGGDFRVTELHRDVAVQKAARAKYDRWVAAGKPKPGSSGFNSSTMKAAFVATPGRSMHNAGRAIDVHIGMLNFPGVPSNKQLDRLWELAKPLGWSPVIKEANEGASEAWHFDFFGEVKGVYDRLGYEQAALCGAILVGHGDLDSHAARVQALLCRAGFNIGAIDGAAGAKTLGALATALGVSADAAKALFASGDTSVYARLLALPAK